MKIMMLKSAYGIDREDGATTKNFVVGEEYSATEVWQKRVFQGFVKSGLANEIGGNANVPETKAKRARKSNGQLASDNPSTPDVNEAWEGGKAPKKKAKKS
tara:strand:+ start:165 stop:467 length:303 start_codon:yes stop_codon:yes gene_type:complete